MKTLIYFIFLSSLLCADAFGQQSQSTLILLGGKVFTGDLEKPSAEAVAISEGRVLAIGSNEEIRRLANKNTRIIDLQGRTVIPGINDAHFHFMPKPAGVQLDFKNM